MPDRKTTDAEWNAVEGRTSRTTKTFAQAACPFCSATIREGAWGSRNSNWKRHVNACPQNPENHPPERSRS